MQKKQTVPVKLSIEFIRVFSYIRGMGLQVIQLDKTLKISGDNDIKRLLKRDRNKKQRRRLKNPDNEPEYKKYNGWFD